MKCWFFMVLFGSVCPLAVFSQEYGYTHYGIKDGLPGTTVYCMVQDRDGFLWFGTELGLSRFDGTHFKNFTKADGLPDNEIIQLFADSKGRVWISPFNKSVCYYYKGKIYNKDNDPVLKRIRIDDYITRFAEDRAGNILMHEQNKLNLLHVNGDVDIIDSINSKPVVFINAIAAAADGGFLIVDDARLYKYKNNRFQFQRSFSVVNNHFANFALNTDMVIWRTGELTSCAFSFIQNKKIDLPCKLSQLGFSLIDDDHFGVCTKEGAILYSISRPDSALPLLPDLPVSRMLKDGEGNIWFTTLGHGIYKLSSPYVRNIKIRHHNQQAQVFSLAQYNGSIIASTEINILYRVNRKTGVPEKEHFVLEEHGMNPVFATSVYKNKIICGTGMSVYQFEPNAIRKGQVNKIAVKGLFQYRDRLYVATKDNVFVVNSETFKITDTIWRERSTTIFVSNDTAYIGTLRGLYCCFPDRSIQYMGEKFPALKNRVTAIQKDAAGVLWVGTYGDGLIGFKDNRVVAIISQRNGLTSDVCRTLHLSGNALWVGTDKGLNKINLGQVDYPVTKYTNSDGLASEIINAVYVDSNNVYVGTPEGITIFDEDKMTSQSRCDLRLVDVTIGHVTVHPDNAPVSIPHDSSSIQFNYAGISYKSNGDIRYRYRLLGLDSTWKETRETFLSYPTLPSGDYQLQLQAINKFDVHSQVITASFAIEKLLYEKTWFRILIGLLFLTLTATTVLLIIRRIRKREREKTTMSKRIGELEQLSRKAQMNPHFIFNSLNSIQQYVMDADVAGANKFIAGFSRLIRQTLDFSSKPEISLEEELDYLTNYLEIERTRLENAFAWSVVIEDGVDPDDYYIPPMILQPFVENSVRHGLRFRKDKAGAVTITIQRQNDHLVCILEDNGIGRKAAMQYKSISPINYQSKGLSLTADRIAMFNQEHKQKITMQIDDLEDEYQNAVGTRVTISFPV